MAGPTRLRELATPLYISMSTVAWRRRGGGRMMLLAALALGVGCERHVPPSSTNAEASKQDPRSPRIKKRDALHPEGPSKKSRIVTGKRK
jgi:hypothetical protein